MAEELGVFKTLRRNPHVIRFIESGQKYYFTEKSQQMYKAKLVNYVVLELATHGDLYEYLITSNKGFSEKLARHLLK